MTVRLILGGTAVAAGAAYHIVDLRKEIESANKKAESAHRTLELQTKEMEIRLECQRRDMESRLDSQHREMESRLDSQRREYNSKLENTKSSCWSSWFW